MIWNKKLNKWRIKMSKWMKDRFDERTTWDGTTLILFGIVVIFFSPTLKTGEPAIDLNF